MERYSDRAIEIINELHTERLDYESEYLPLIDCAKRCADYENTDLTPEQVAGAIALNDFLTDSGVSIDHVRELVKAERAGRLAIKLTGRIGSNVIAEDACRHINCDCNCEKCQMQKVLNRLAAFEDVLFDQTKS